jgi:hypothetical protein
MSRLNRSAHAPLVLIILASLVGIASADAQGQKSWERRDHRSSVGERPAARQETEARVWRRTHPGRAEGFHDRARWEASRAREHSVIPNHQRVAGRSIQEQRVANNTIMREAPLASGGRAREIPRGLAGGRLRVVRYGNTLSGTVERVIRPGLTTRTFVGGGRVLSTHVYQRHVWYGFGRSFAYETFVPAVRFPAVYYAWALGMWSRPVTYSWGWQVQPWYPMYGPLFTPYPVYTSPDLWMTDYIIAQSMQTAYQAQTVAPASEPPPEGAAAAPVPDSSVAEPDEQPSDLAPAPQPSDAPPAPASSDTPYAPVALPPAITPQVKAQLDAQIKVQLQEQQAAAATPAVLTTQSTPPALRPNHVFFEVVEPLHVPSGTANRYCSLSPNDYIRRVGGMSNDDWMIPVVVELSESSDCPEGLHTRIGLNDLNAMENEQEAQVMEAMQAASKSMGPNGPPNGPGAQPTLVAAGNAAPDPNALDAIRQAP